MAPVAPYALSIHGFIDKVGADAGFAAIIGVALVVIMLFVHARETASLRARAEDAEDRVEYLERAVEQLGRSTAQATQLAQAAQAQTGGRPAAVPAAARAPTGTQRPAPAPAVAAAYATTGRPRVSGPPPLLPAAPVGSAGPALSSATRLIPDSARASSNGHRNGGAGAAAALAPAAAAVPAPPPSTAAAGAPAAMPQFPPPRDEEGSASRARPDDTGTRSVRRDYGRAAEPRGRRRLVPLIAVAVLVAAIAVAAVLVLLNHHTTNHGASSAGRTRSTSSRTSTAKGRRRAVTVDPRSVTVAVLNGTTTSNLAADISQKLGRVGFKQGKTANFNTQSLTTTTIGYQPGHRAQALAVAKALKVKFAHVLGVTASTRQLVCPASGTCPDQVFVVLGSDLASAA